MDEAAEEGEPQIEISPFLPSRRRRPVDRDVISLLYFSSVSS